MPTMVATTKRPTSDSMAKCSDGSIAAIGAAALFMPFAALAGIALMLLFFSLSIFDSVTGLLGLKKEITDVGIFDEAVQAYAIQNIKESYAKADKEKHNVTS